MYMVLLERILLRFMLNKKVKMEVIGFDTDAFSKAMHRELMERLETIESIILEDGSDTSKVRAIKLLFEREFYIED